MSNEVLQRRLADLATYLVHLQAKVPTQREEYLANLDTRLICERLVELLVEAATDVNSALMMQARREPPPSSYDAFIINRPDRVYSCGTGKEISATRRLTEPTGARI